MIEEFISNPSEVQDEEWEWPRDIQTVEEWMEACDETCFTDWDGHGEMLTKSEDGDHFIFHGRIYPSERHTIPPHITHIEWINK